MLARGDETRLPSVWPYLGLGALLALLVTFGEGFHVYHNSDSLVPVMVSLCRWTSYYWNGNRVGMLLPALALPLQHPFYNLLAQVGMTVFSAFAFVFLLARYALPRPSWPLAGCAGVALLLLLPTKLRFYVITFQQMHYPVALALAVGSLLLLQVAAGQRPPWWRILASFALMALALWVNIGTAVVAGPLILLHALRNARLDGLLSLARQAFTRETVLALGVLVAAYATADLNRRAHPVDGDPVKAGFAKVMTWPRTWGKVAAGMWREEIRPRWPTYLTPVLLTAGLFLIPAVRRRCREPIGAALVVLGAGVASALVSGSTKWVQGSYDWRYWFPLYYLALAALSLVLAAPLAECFPPRLRKAATACASLALLLLAVRQYGVPSAAVARADVDKVAGGIPAALADDLIREECTHVAGDYWAVVTCAYYTNLRLHEQGLDRKVWPVTVTSCETWDDWARIPPSEMRVAVPLVTGRPDPEAEVWLRNLAPVSMAEMAVVKRHPTHWVLRPADPLALEQPHPDGSAVRATWHSGFYAAEAESRWCQRRGELTITNPADQPRTVTLRLDLSVKSTKGARVRIEGGEVHDSCEVSRDGASYERAVTLPARGATTFVFTTDAPRVSLRKEDWRRTHFRVSHFQLLEGVE